jgi:hypothetical protein
MSLFALLTRRNGLRRQPQPYRYRPQLEVLEGRALPSMLTVMNTNDSGMGSLRSEILVARARIKEPRLRLFRGEPQRTQRTQR